jgi:DNA-binding HxlR family transcriptional regulator
MTVKTHELENCPVTATLEIIGGKWKMLVIYLVSNGINRFGKMSMMMKDISKQMLTTQLRELERDGLLERVIYPEIPPRVEYFLTPKAKALLPALMVLRDWGNEYALEKPVEVASV